MMELLATVVSKLTASEVALLTVALQYAALTPVWVAAALLLPGDRRAAGAWALYAGGSALALLFIVIGMHSGDAAVRAVGNVLVIAATLALQHGVWAFTGRPSWRKTQAVLLGVVVLLAALAALDPTRVPLRIGGVSAIWAALYAWTAADIWQHTRLTMRKR